MFINIKYYLVSNTSHMFSQNSTKSQVETHTVILVDTTILFWKVELSACKKVVEFLFPRELFLLPSGVGLKNTIFGLLSYLDKKIGWN